MKNCGRLGHIAIRCRSTKRCLDCGKFIICPNQCKEQKCNDCLTNTKCKEQCDTPKCILCNGNDHNATEQGKCSRWKSEKEIKSLMTLSNLSRKEVIKAYPESQNYYNILADGSYDSHFPTINKSSNQNIRNFNDEINRRITKIKYSKIAAPHTKINHPVASPITVAPSIPVFEHPSFAKVSDLEKTMSMFTKQMSQLLTSLNCAEGLDILENFRKSLLPGPAKNTKYKINSNENSQTPKSNSYTNNQN